MPARNLVAWALALCLHATLCGTGRCSSQSPDLFRKVQQVFAKHCGECHGKGKRVRGDLDLWDKGDLFTLEREWQGRSLHAVVPGDASRSLVLIRLLDKKKPMPPKNKGSVPPEQIELVRRWIVAGAPTADQAAGQLPATADTRPIEEIVRTLFDSNCVNCHSGARPKGGLRVLDYGDLIKKRLIVPKNLQQSKLYIRLLAEPQTGKRMPPPSSGYTLKPDEIRAIENWILRGAPSFDQTIQVDRSHLGRRYVWRAILEDVRKMNVDASEDIPFTRYVSFNHLVAAGITRRELKEHGQALALAVNHLSWRAELYRPVPIDPPLNSIYRIDIRKLGLDQQPFKNSEISLYDLVLLEFPYGVFDNGDPTFRSLVREFLTPARQAVPIAYVHGDWLIAKALQSPLYEDLLQLPLTIDELEKRLGVDSDANLKNFKVIRAGMSVSGVSRNNRIVERHPSKVGIRYYWKSYDFASSRGADNMFRNPIDLRPAGGEMIWSLPNGLQGYFVTDASGRRISEAPTSIVTDEFASDQIVRNGLGCIRCHTHGMQPVRDDVNPFLKKLRGNPFAFNRLRALRIYPGAEKAKQLVTRDAAIFTKALEKLFGKGTSVNGAILRPITQRYLDQSISGLVALAEAGMDDPAGNVAGFKTRGMIRLGLLQLADNGLIRRDAWEDLYDRVVEEMVLGESMRPLDSVTRLDFKGAEAPDIVLRTNKDGNLFRKGDEPVIIVENKSAKPVFCEVIGFGGKGNKFALTKRIAGNAVTEIKAGEKLELKLKKVGDTFGTETVVLYASSQKFEEGTVTQLDNKDPGVRIAPRVIHRWYSIDGGQIVANVTPRFFVKKSITVETR